MHLTSFIVPGLLGTLVLLAPLPLDPTGTSASIFGTWPFCIVDIDSPLGSAPGTEDRVWWTGVDVGPETDGVVPEGCAWD
jgi:hypothetical protein